MAQSTITSFFAHRKRPATEESTKARSKVMRVDRDAGYVQATSASVGWKLTTTVNSKNKNTENSSLNQPFKPKLKVVKRTVPRKSIKPTAANQSLIRIFVKDPGPEKPYDELTDKECKPENLETNRVPSNVLFEIKGLLAPETKYSEASSPTDSHLMTTVLKSFNEKNLCDDSESRKTNEKQTGIENPKAEPVEKELSLADLRSKLNQSSRRGDLIASMARFGQTSERLKKIQELKHELIESHDSSKSSKADKESKPQLNQLGTIHLQVPKSPPESPLISPIEGSPGLSSPAFKRYSSLALPGTPALLLPYTYRHLAVMFSWLDKAALLYNLGRRKRTFEELQSVVQRMSRKTFTKQHVAQIATVFPEAFSLKQEKLSKYASPNKQRKYRLVLIPVLPENTAGGDAKMASLLEEREAIFKKRLTEIVMDHHDKFLKSLDPPMVIPSHKLARWHPEFPLDEVPDITPSALPQPPNEERCSAKDALEKARKNFLFKSPFEKALEKVDVNLNTEHPLPELGRPAYEKLLSAFKKVPIALLEKVLANKAAKALVAMSWTSAQEKEASRYSRLPEIARILRYVFVCEKKAIRTLKLKRVIEKVRDSHSTSLSEEEVKKHLELLVKAVPSWLSVKRLLNTDYLTLAKDMELKDILKSLMALAEEKYRIKS